MRVTTKVLCCVIAFFIICSYFCGISKSKKMDTPYEYQELLLYLEKVLDFRISDDFEEVYNKENAQKFGELSEYLDNENTLESEILREHWNAMIVEMTQNKKYFSKECFGYVLKDINEDGYQELFFVRNDHCILSVFTIYKGKVYLLDAFWSKHSCVITNKSELYVLSTGGAQYSFYSIRKLLFGSNKLSTIMEFSLEGIDEKTHDKVYYVSLGNNKKSITSEEFSELLTQYPFKNLNIWYNMDITFW